MRLLALCCGLALTLPACAEPPAPPEPSPPAPTTAPPAAGTPGPDVDSAADPLPPETLGDGWTAGVTDVSRAVGGVATQRAARTAAHDEFDRFVAEFGEGGLPGYHLEYVDRPVYQCGSGRPIEVSGDARLLLRFQPARAHDDEGRATVEARDSLPDLPVLLETLLICDFEGHVEWLLGVSAPNRYRVVELTEPARLVVDIRHF